ncbi:MAG: S-layer protein [Methanocalculus sp.]|uniref:COG1361 S-layer family protein n=1 Tax=Methanocalculus sp. TaxID=2004547 RepID=UPI002726BEFC|nr:S-layer protein [Methanocalculus sp.]MDO9539098.1 S-layer protein [Methanocalculus sp.]
MERLDRVLLPLSSLVLLLCLVSLLISPATAGFQFSTTGPEMVVAIAGSDEFLQGYEGQIIVSLENRGKMTFEFFRLDQLTPQYLPTTARSLTATLEPGDAPVKVKSSTQIVGEMPSGMVRHSFFNLEVPKNAESGDYTLSLILAYEYLYMADQDGPDYIRYQFKTVKKTYPLRIRVSPDVKLDVLSAVPEDLSAGGMGYINLTVRNAGTVNARELALYLTPASIGPVVPVGDGVYIGSFGSGETINLRYKLSVTRDADPKQSYPVLLFARYLDEEGIRQTSGSEVVGVRFSSRAKFSIVGSPPVVNPGTATVSVTYVNAGEYPVYQAQARISLVDPFTSKDNSIYLGTMQPGETVIGLFSLTTDKEAVLKEYLLNSEIRYIDGEGKSYTSDNIGIVISVERGESVTPLTMGVLAGVVCLLVIGLAIYWMRQKGGLKR